MTGGRAGGLVEANLLFEEAGSRPIGGSRGSSEMIEPSSMTTDPVTSPPVSAPYSNRSSSVVGASGSSAGHHVFPCLAAELVAQRVLQRRQELGVDGFAATAGPKDRSDQRRHRDHVVDGGRFAIQVVGRPVGVHAVGVGLGVGDDLLAFVAVGVEDELHLVGDELFGRLAGHELLGAGDQTEGVDAGKVGDGSPRRAPAQADQQVAVSGGDPAAPKARSSRVSPVMWGMPKSS